jgi:hypothetical protein
MIGFKVIDQIQHVVVVTILSNHLYYFASYQTHSL